MKKPSPPLLLLDQYSLRRLTTADATLVLKLREACYDNVMVDLPESKELCELFIENMLLELWGLPMMAFQHGEPIGIMYTNQSDPRNLNAHLVTMFKKPTDARLPLIMYIRHLFWNFLLHRIYTHCPALEQMQNYPQMYISAGFQQEGLLLKHKIIAEQRYDVAVFGLLRKDFDRWCQEYEKRLEL